MSQGDTSGQAPDSFPPARHGWYAVGVLTVAYTVSFIDRQIMALMVEPIRRDLGISDTQISLLIGLAFALFYTVLGIPIARLADRFNRKVIITTGIVVWCAMTAFCGLSKNYIQLFLARVGVGVGEAALGPSALSMMSDYFPRERRGRAIAVYNMGITLGSGLAMILGGHLIDYVLNTPRIHVPLAGELYPWQAVFILVGLPGLVVALAMLTIREPARRERMQAAGGGDQLPLPVVVSFLTARWRMYLTHFFGMSTVAMLAYAMFAWIPTMFIRTWGWKISQIGLAYGIVTLVAGPLSAMLSAWLGEKLARQHQDAHMRAVVWTLFMALCGAVLTTLMPSPWLAVLMLVPVSVGTTAATASGLSALMTIAPNQMRAQVSALYYLVVNVVGLTVGPTGVALFTDFVFRDESALRYSILCVTVLGGTLSMLLLTYNLRHYRAAYAEARGWTTG